MKDVVFFTPNKGMRSAAKFIFAALNKGGPQRFGSISFDLKDENSYDTHYRVSNESMLSIETTQVCGEEEPQFLLVVTLRVQSFTGSIKSRKIFQLSEKQPRFPEINKTWQEQMCRELGHMKADDLWDNLLEVKKISSMPL